MLVDVENTSRLARLPVDRLIRDAEWHDRSGIFKIPLPIESIHLLHDRLDCVGLLHPSGLQALEQVFDRVTIVRADVVVLTATSQRSPSSDPTALLGRGDPATELKIAEP